MVEKVIASISVNGGIGSNSLEIFYLYSWASLTIDAFRIFKLFLFYLFLLFLLFLFLFVLILNSIWYNRTKILFHFNFLKLSLISGFAFFLTSSIFLFIYLIWAIIPTPWLESIEITYVPAKYWAISIPLLFPIIVTAYVTTVFALNLIRFHGVFENIAVREFFEIL